jgi:hypothetical protein
MPRRSILSATERESLLALPDNRDDLIRRYTLSESDLSDSAEARRTDWVLRSSFATFAIPVLCSACIDFRSLHCFIWSPLS